MALLILLLAGCGIDPGVTPDAVELKARITWKGKPLTNATLHLQPTSNGAQAALPVRNGEVHAAVVPGQYAYYFEGANSAITRAIPEHYRAGSLERLVEIGPRATALNLSIE
jgi:hypothetical protein